MTKPIPEQCEKILVFNQKGDSRFSVSYEQVQCEKAKDHSSEHRAVVLWQKLEQSVGICAHTYHAEIILSVDTWRNDETMTKKTTSIKLNPEIWKEFQKLCLDLSTDASPYLEELIKKELTKRTGKNYG